MSEETVKKIDIRKQEAEIARRQKQQAQQARIEGLLRIYQDASLLVDSKVSVLAVATRKGVINELSGMVNIVERDDWAGVHPHDAFPDIDIRMLAYGCPASVECPLLLAILKKIEMKQSDYTDYRKRMGMMIAMEHSRHRIGVGKHR